MIPGNLGIIFTGDTQYPLSESGEDVDLTFGTNRSAVEDKVHGCRVGEIL